MFYPQAMSEIELIVPSRDLLAVTKVLSKEGVFQQADNSYLGLDNNASKSGKDNTWNTRAAAFASLERRIQTILQSLGVDEGYPPTVDSTDHGDPDRMVELETVTPQVEQIEREVRDNNERLTNEQKRQE